MPRTASSRIIVIPRDSDPADEASFSGAPMPLQDLRNAATNGGVTTPEKPPLPTFNLPPELPTPSASSSAEHRHRTEAEVEAEVQQEEAATFEMIKKYQNLLCLVVGVAILLYGHFFPKTLLVVQAVSVSGGGKLWQAAKDLYHHFLVAKKCLEDELPELARAKDVLQDLAVEIAATMKSIAEHKAQFQAGKVSQGHHDLMTAELNKSLQALRAREQQLTGLNSSLGRVCAAVNPRDISEICLSVYVCIAAAAAAVSHNLLARVAMALKIGASLSEKVLEVRGLDTSLFACPSCVFSSTAQPSLPSPCNQHALKHDTHRSSETGAAVDAQQEWLKTIIRFLSNCIGFSLSYYVEEKVAIYSMCVLGSKTVVDAFEGLVDEFVVTLKLKNNEQTTYEMAAKTVKEMLFVGLVAAGIVIHVQYATLLGLEQGSWTWWALWPVFWFEDLVHSGRLQ